MINVLIVNKNTNYCIKLLNNLCNKNSEIRIANIANSFEDMYNFTNITAFDVILLDLNLLLNANSDKYIDNFMKKYKKSIIILYNKIDIVQKYSKFNYISKYNFDDILKKLLKVATKKR